MDKSVVVVNGANGDIGFPLVEALLEADYAVAACIRSIEISKFDAAEGLTLFECDFSDTASIEQCVTLIKKTYKNIFGIINCIGIPHGASFMMLNKNDFEEVFKINYFAPVIFTQQLVRKMLKKRQGSIVNIASTAGILSDAGTLAYGASKAALIHSTKVMATELGLYGIRVNAIAPAVVESRMSTLMDENSIRELDQKAALSSKIYPEEIVDMALYLLSDSSKSLTKQVLTIDRGITQ